MGYSEDLFILKFQLFHFLPELIKPDRLVLLIQVSAGVVSMRTQCFIQLFQEHLETEVLKKSCVGKWSYSISDISYCNTSFIQNREYSSTREFHQVANDLIVKVLDLRPFDSLSFILFLLLLQYQLDE